MKKLMPFLIMLPIMILFFSNQAFTQVNKKTTSSYPNRIKKPKLNWTPPKVHSVFDPVVIGDFDLLCFKYSYSQNDTAIYTDMMPIEETLEFTNNHYNTRLSVISKAISAPTTRKGFFEEDSIALSKDRNILRTQEIKFIEGISKVKGNKLYFTPAKSENYPAQVYTILVDKEKKEIVNLINDKKDKTYTAEECRIVIAPIQPAMIQGIK